MLVRSVLHTFHKLPCLCSACQQGAALATSCSHSPPASRKSRSTSVLQHFISPSASDATTACLHSLAERLVQVSQGKETGRMLSFK